MKASKFISLFLVFALLASSSVYASDTSAELTQNTFDLTAYSLSEHDTVLKDQNENYIMQFSANEYLPVGCVEVNLFNEEEVQNVLDRADISDEIKADLQTASINAIANNNYDAKATIFSSTLLKNTRSNSSIYHYENGTPMRSDKVFYTGIDTGLQDVVTGTSVASICDDIATFGLTVGGFLSPYVSLIGYGYTLGQRAREHYNAVNITGSKQDYLQVAVNYDYTIQYTYALLGDLYNPQEQYLGLVSQSSTVNYVQTRMYYYSAATHSGNVSETTYRVPFTQTSQHFNNPWQTALQHYGGAVQEQGISYNLANVNNKIKLTVHIR